MGVALTPIIIKEQLTLDDLHGRSLAVEFDLRDLLL